MVDLLIALIEYPEAVTMFIEGTELLREGRLFDEYALEDQESAEKVTEELPSFVGIQQIRAVNCCGKAVYLMRMLCRTRISRKMTEELPSFVGIEKIRFKN